METRTQIAEEVWVAQADSMFSVEVDGVAYSEGRAVPSPVLVVQSSINHGHKVQVAVPFNLKVHAEWMNGAGWGRAIGFEIKNHDETYPFALQLGGHGSYWRGISDLPDGILTVGSVSQPAGTLITVERSRIRDQALISLRTDLTDAQNAPIAVQVTLSMMPGLSIAASIPGCAVLIERRRTSEPEIRINRGGQLLQTQIRTAFPFIGILPPTPATVVTGEPERER